MQLHLYIHLKVLNDGCQLMYRYDSAIGYITIRLNDNKSVLCNLEHTISIG